MPRLTDEIPLLPTFPRAKGLRSRSEYSSGGGGGDRGYSESLAAACLAPSVRLCGQTEVSTFERTLGFLKDSIWNWDYSRVSLSSRHIFII